MFQLDVAQLFTSLDPRSMNRFQDQGVGKTALAVCPGVANGRIVQG